MFTKIAENLEILIVATNEIYKGSDYD